MRWIYLSPHLDDAALSAGGLIYEQIQAGTLVEIWTFMCGFPSSTDLSPYAQMLHYQWGMTSAEEVIRGRRQEDFEAAKTLGATTVHFDFLDCIYRKGKNGEWLYSEIFVEPHADDAEYASQIAEAISACLKPDDELVCQFGIGKHVDHVLMRRAAELLGRPLHYAADIPYLFKSGDELDSNRAGMKETAYSVSETSLRAWQEAIAAYASQINVLFENPEAMRSQIAEYCSQNGGVRLWTKQ